MILINFSKLSMKFSKCFSNVPSKLKGACAKPNTNLVNLSISMTFDSSPFSFLLAPSPAPILFEILVPVLDPLCA